METLASWSWYLDGWIVAAAVLSAVAAALLGNFLVLRKMSMLGDAISHAILPGLAAAFFITGSRSSLPMFFGAVFVGLLTAFFTQWLQNLGKVDEGASIGVVFTTLFALGLVMIVQAADHVDLDPECVLYGAIELTPLDTWVMGGWEVPRVVVVLSMVLLLNAAFVTLFFKELKISSFDPALASASGFPAALLHYLLMTLVAVTAVASFETVGNILVVAMFIVPPAAARMLTDRLHIMVMVSVVVAAGSAVLGHLAALSLPAEFGYRSTSTAGMIALTAGTFLLLAALLAPRHGIVIRMLRRKLLTWQVLAEDLLALLYRLEERASTMAPTRAMLQSTLMSGPLNTRLVIAVYRLRGLVRQIDNRYQLSSDGTERARRLIRSHRLWESYLVREAGVPAARTHNRAEDLEHFTDREMRDKLTRQTAVQTTDPHGRPIPEE